MMKITELAVDQIDPPHHSHRLDFDEAAMQELMDSIADHGLEQPIKVRPSGERYEIIFGHRRWEAHRRLRRLTIPALIAKGESDTKTERARFAENLQRSDLTPMEEATAIDQAMRGCSLDEPAIARLLSRSPAWVRARLALLTLTPDLQDALHTRAISTGAALALADVDDAAHRTYLLEHAVRGGASIAVIRSWVSEYQTQRAAAGDAPLAPPDHSRPPTPAVILLECTVCQKPHDHTTLQIARICIPCLKEIQR